MNGKAELTLNDLDDLLMSVHVLFDCSIRKSDFPMGVNR